MNQYDLIRPDIRASLDRYAERGIPTGDFLRAVLSNDLMDAMGRADDYNRSTLYEICSYVYNELPGLCHGSPEYVNRWLEKHRQRAEHEQHV